MAPRTILLADSDEDTRVVYSTILQYGGFQVLEASSGMEVLEMAYRHTPDAVITELSLPGTQGCEVLRRLKQHPHTCHIPIFVVTADASPRSRREAQEASCDAFVLKPYKPRDLLRDVYALLDPLTLTVIA